MSEVKVNKISPRTNCGTVQLGDSGDTITIPAGATITNNGTQTGFGRTGTVDWQTSIKTAASFTAANGEGYFVDTSSNAVTVNLPAGSVGAIVAFKDYAQNFDNNNLTISANGSDKIEGQTFDKVLSTEGIAVTAVYGDATKGWQFVNSNEVTNVASFVAATGGTVTTVCTNFKVHTFTGPGTFCVSCGGNSGGSNTVSYLVVAGGGGAGKSDGGGGGGGGFREGKTPCTPYTASPLVAPAGLPVTAQGYPITVGSGGAGGLAPTTGGPGVKGSDSIFSTITSTGGGLGSGHDGPAGGPGGSGGGGSSTNPAAGSGNTPSVSPPQGNNGGTAGGGGGGATAVGANGPGCTAGGAGGTTHISGSPLTKSAGGGGDRPGGSAGSNAAANSGGGGQGICGGGPGPGPGGSGGSGIVIIRYKFQ